MNINKICVVGAGTMGSQIVQLAAQKGFQVSMVDTAEGMAQKAMDSIKGSIKKFFVDKGKISQEEAEKWLGRIEGTSSLEKAVKDADIVIEAIFEDMEVKKQLFKKLEGLCSKEAILVSNTSALSITEIGSLTQSQDRVIGMHFFNPVPMMKLIEIIRGAKTSDQTCETIRLLAQSFGKEPVIINDAPGFVSSRILAVIINEAARIIYEGIATPEQIDKICELGLGHAMGPLKTSDLTNSMGIGLHVLSYLQAELGEAYRPCPLYKKKTLAGEIGMATGKGFYTYNK